MGKDFSFLRTWVLLVIYFNIGLIGEYGSNFTSLDYFFEHGTVSGSQLQGKGPAINNDLSLSLDQGHHSLILC